jgi:hypothetical protein
VLHVIHHTRKATSFRTCSNYIPGHSPDVSKQLVSNREGDFCPRHWNDYFVAILLSAHFRDGESKESEELLIQLRGLRCFQTRKDVSRRLRSLRPYGVRISPIRAVGYVALNVYYSSMISVVVTVVSAIKLAE